MGHNKVLIGFWEETHPMSWDHPLSWEEILCCDETHPVLWKETPLVSWEGNHPLSWQDLIVCLWRRLVPYHGRRFCVM